MAAGDLAAAAGGSLASGGGLAGPVPLPANPAVRLAVAIGLFWLAGLCFYVAFGRGAADLVSWSGTGGGLAALRAGLRRSFARGASTVSADTAAASA